MPVCPACQLHFALQDLNADTASRRKMKVLYIDVLSLTLDISDGDLYVGTVGQFSGADPLIYRKPLRTEQFDLKHLNGKYSSYSYTTTSRYNEQFRRHVDVS